MKRVFGPPDGHDPEVSGLKYRQFGALSLPKSRLLFRSEENAWDFGLGAPDLSPFSG
jgi:hypothetical protein